MNLGQFPTSTLVTRFTNDVRQVQNTIFMGLRIMVRAPLMVLGGVFMAFFINVKLSFIFLFWVLNYASTMFKKVLERVDNVNRIMQENLTNMRLIKAFLRRNFETERFTKANVDLATMTRKTFRFVEASMPILLFVMNLSLIFIIWCGNIQSVSGETDVGDVIAIINYALRIAMAISMFTFITMAFSRAKASALRLNDVLTVNTELIDDSYVNKEAKITDGSIQFHEVSFSYPNFSTSALNQISFNVKTHEKLAILGATGAGKTTLFQLIPRLYNADKILMLKDGKIIEKGNHDELLNLGKNYYHLYKSQLEESVY